MRLTTQPCCIASRRRSIFLSAFAALALCADARAAIAQDSTLTMAGTASAADTARSSARKCDRGSTCWIPWVLGAQINVIYQNLRPFDAAYSGANSLLSTGDAKTSEAYGVYFGGRVVAGLQAYLDVEAILGDGVSNVNGLGGLTNGDVLRQGATLVPRTAYVARAFLRYTIPLTSADSDRLDPAMDQAAMTVPKRRIEIMAGKFALNDMFDLNRYAGSTRLQFENWALWENTAWDFAADTRGYTNGVVLSWFEPRWILRVASAQMPTFANGDIFDGHVRDARGDEAELTLMPGDHGTIVRLLAYDNHGRMGNYAEALTVAQKTGTTPDIVADDQPGRVKYGFGVNVEQPLADSGATGLFARLGWDDGKTESFVFTEVDQHVSLGVQVAGTRWARHDDRFGFAFFAHGLSDVHREYLAAGGLGFLLGDGKINYGSECGMETYYRVQLGRWVQLSPDVQYIWNPGYNRDRGPATIVGFRFNARY